MMTNKRRIKSYLILALAFSLFVTLRPQTAQADDGANTTTSTTTKNTTVTATSVPEDTRIGSRPGISIGGGAMYSSPRDAQQGTLYGEAQLRVHMTSSLAIEGLAGYEQNKFSGTTVNVIPVQASLLIYLLPGHRVSPYILGGGGWYYTQVQGQSGSQNRFGPHAGAGLEVFLDKCWSIDGSWRYIWNENIHSQNAAHPLGQNISAGGFMVTTAINYHF